MDFCNFWQIHQQARDIFYWLKKKKKHWWREFLHNMGPLNWLEADVRQVTTLRIVRTTVGGHDYKTTFLSNIVGYFLKQDKNKPKYSKIQFIIPDCMLAWSKKKLVCLILLHNDWSVHHLEYGLKFVVVSNMFDKSDSNHWLLLQRLSLFLFLLSVRARTATLIWQCRWHGENWIELRFSPKWNGKLSGNRWHVDMCFIN